MSNFSYIDPILGGEEVSCLLQDDWVCMVAEGRAIRIVHPDLCIFDSEDTSSTRSLDPKVGIPALKFEGIARLLRADWKQVALARIAEQRKPPGEFPRPYAFATAVILARAEYLQRSSWLIG